MLFPIPPFRGVQSCLYCARGETKQVRSTGFSRKPAAGPPEGGTTDLAAGPPEGGTTNLAAGPPEGGTTNLAAGPPEGGTTNLAAGPPEGGATSLAAGPPEGGTTSLAGCSLSTAIRSVLGPMILYDRYLATHEDLGPAGGVGAAGDLLPGSAAAGDLAFGPGRHLRSGHLVALADRPLDRRASGPAHGGLFLRLRPGEALVGPQLARRAAVVRPVPGLSGSSGSAFSWRRWRWPFSAPCTSCSAGSSRTIASRRS